MAGRSHGLPVKKLSQHAPQKLSLRAQGRVRYATNRSFERSPLAEDGVDFDEELTETAVANAIDPLMSGLLGQSPATPPVSAHDLIDIAAVPDPLWAASRDRSFAYS